MGTLGQIVPIADRRSHDRFVEITLYTHFVNNTNLPSQGEAGFDRLGKVGLVMEYIQSVPPLPSCLILCPPHLP